MTIGLDLGDKRRHAVVLDTAGEEIEDRSIATSQDAFQRVFNEYTGALLVMEVGTHSPWASRLFKARGFRVVVANPRQVRLISESQHKSDPFDARLLARLGRADPKLLAPVRHRGEAAQRDRSLLQARDGLVRCRVLLVNQVRGLTKSLGYRVPRCSPTVFPRRVRETVPNDLFPGLAAAPVGEAGQWAARAPQDRPAPPIHSCGCGPTPRVCRSRIWELGGTRSACGGMRPPGRWTSDNGGCNLRQRKWSAHRAVH